MAHNGKFVELAPGIQVGDDIFISARAFDSKFMARHTNVPGFGWRETLAHEIGHTRGIGVRQIQFGPYGSPEEYLASFQGSLLPSFSGRTNLAAVTNHSR
jgi:hypothetical protein